MGFFFFFCLNKKIFFFWKISDLRWNLVVAKIYLHLNCHNDISSCWIIIILFIGLIFDTDVLYFIFREAIEREREQRNMYNKLNTCVNIFDLNVCIWERLSQQIHSVLYTHWHSESSNWKLSRVQQNVWSPEWPEFLQRFIAELCNIEW